MPAILSIQLHHTNGKPLSAVASVRGLLDLGLEGDSHSQGRPGRKRQVLLLDVSTLDAFGLQPGDLREQITVTGLPEISLLPAGTRLQAGDLTFEAVGECEPCLWIGEMLNIEDREAFRKALVRRRGLLCRVVEAVNEGWVRVGDEVSVQQ